MEFSGQWMRQATNPFPKGSWIICSGRILGVLNRELFRGPQVVNSSVRILVVLPDEWEFIRQNALSTQNTSIPTSLSLINKSLLLPRLAGLGGVVSRSLLLSSIHGRNPQVRPDSPILAPNKLRLQATTPATTATVRVDVDSSSPWTITQIRSNCWMISSLLQSTPTQKRKRQDSP